MRSDALVPCTMNTGRIFPTSTQVADVRLRPRTSLGRWRQAPKAIRSNTYSGQLVVREMGKVGVPFGIDDRVLGGKRDGGQLRAS